MYSDYEGVLISYGKLIQSTTMLDLGHVSWLIKASLRGIPLHLSLNSVCLLCLRCFAYPLECNLGNFCHCSIRCSEQLPGFLVGHTLVPVSMKYVMHISRYKPIELHNCRYLVNATSTRILISAGAKATYTEYLWSLVNKLNYTCGPM